MTKDDIVSEMLEFMADTDIPEDNLTGWSLVVALDPFSVFVRSQNISVQDFLLPIVQHISNIEDAETREGVVQSIVAYLLSISDTPIEYDDDCGVFVTGAGDIGVKN